MQLRRLRRDEHVAGVPQPRVRFEADVQRPILHPRFDERKDVLVGLDVKGLPWSHADAGADPGRDMDRIERRYVAILRPGERTGRDQAQKRNNPRFHDHPRLPEPRVDTRSHPEVNFRALRFQGCAADRGGTCSAPDSGASRRYPHSLSGQAMYGPSFFEYFDRRYGFPHCGHGPGMGRSHAANLQLG